MKVSIPTEKMLTPLEQIAFSGLLAKDNAIRKQYLEPFNQEYELFCQTIADRLGFTLKDLVSDYEIAVDRLIPKVKKNLSVE